MKIYYTYIFHNLVDKIFYTGVTSDINACFLEHNDRLKNITSYSFPIRLVYFEQHDSLEKAKENERKLKEGDKIDSSKYLF